MLEVCGLGKMEEDASIDTDASASRRECEDEVENLLSSSPIPLPPELTPLEGT